MTDITRQKVRELIDAMPDWAVPIWMRAGERLANGDPIDEVWDLVKKEAAVARAEARHDGRV